MHHIITGSSMKAQITKFILCFRKLRKLSERTRASSSKTNLTLVVWKKNKIISYFSKYILLLIRTGKKETGTEF